MTIPQQRLQQLLLTTSPTTCLDNLADALANDVLLLSDAQLLAEAQQANENINAIAEEVKTLLQQTFKTYGKTNHQRKIR